MQADPCLEFNRVDKECYRARISRGVYSLMNRLTDAFSRKLCVQGKQMRSQPCQTFVRPIVSKALLMIVPMDPGVEP